jgi:hypothetical protein
LGYFFPHFRLYINFDKKVAWASFWAIFSRTHLVTMAGTKGNKQRGNSFEYLGAKLEKE